MPAIVEIVLAHIIYNMGENITFNDLLKWTNMSKKTLKKILWYCQRRKLVKRDVGLYRVTAEGVRLIRDSKVTELKRRMYVLRIEDEIFVVILGKKLRVRRIKVNLLKNILQLECFEAKRKEEFNKQAIITLFWFLKVLGALKQKNEKICIEKEGIEHLKRRGLIDAF